MEILVKLLVVLTLNGFAADAYMRVERSVSCPRIFTDFPGRVKYKRKGTRAAFRCPKKFDRYGDRFSTCRSDGTWSNDPPLCIKSGCVPLDPSQVTNLDMEVVNGALVKFSCLEDFNLIGESMAYCNGKDWSSPLPRCAAPHELLECDFEINLCGWEQDENAEQNWIINVGSTQTGNTGPKYDHTLGDTGNGHYLYFETSNPTMTGDQANLISQMYPEELSPICFDFWYHILGPDEAGHVGSLEVYILDESQFLDDDDIQPAFVKEGNQGDKWHKGDIFIDKQDEPFQIAIVATRALSYISDIAIDDLRLYNCSQTSTSTPEIQTSTLPTTTTTTTTSSTTSQVPDTTTTIVKTVTSSPTQTTTKSPTSTRVKTETVTESQTTKTTSTSTTKTVTTSSPQTTSSKEKGSTAKRSPITTPKVVMSSSGSTMKSMKSTRLFPNTRHNNNTWSSIFSKTTMKDSTPQSTASTTESSMLKTSEKTKTSQPKTSETGCVPPDPSQVTKLDMEVVEDALVKFSCHDEYNLIGESMAYCNGKDWSAPLPRCEARNVSLECDFEIDLCGWDTERKWIRNVGPTPTIKTGPQSDHTLGDTGNGHYLYFETSNPVMPGDEGHLVSQIYPEEFSPMCFDFWYHIHGPDEIGHVGSLEVHILDEYQFLNNEDIQPLFVKKGNQGNKWQKGEIFIDKQHESYQIAIVATRAQGLMSDIAIDDVRLYNCSQRSTSPPEVQTSLLLATATTTTTSSTTSKNPDTIVTLSPKQETTKLTTTKSPTSTKVKTETLTESQTTKEKRTTTTNWVTTPSLPATSFKKKASSVKQSTVTTPKDGATMKSPKTSQNTSLDNNTRSSILTKMKVKDSTPQSTASASKGTTSISSEKNKPSRPKTPAGTSEPKPTLSSSSRTSATSTTKTPILFQTTSESVVTTSSNTSLSATNFDQKLTTKTTTESSSKPTRKTTASTVSKPDTPKRGTERIASSSTVSTSSSNSFLFSSSSSFTLSSSTSGQLTANRKTDGTKSKATTSVTRSQTIKDKSDFSQDTIYNVKPTKRTNELTTKSLVVENLTKVNSIEVLGISSQHSEDDILKPLMIGLGVGIVAGLIIIGNIVYVCIHRRQLYTSRYVDKKKPVTQSVFIRNLNYEPKVSEFQFGAGYSME